MRKDAILRFLGLVQLSAIAVTSWTLLSDDWAPADRFRMLCVALGLWGVAQGNSPVLDALFADSVPTGCRSRMYTRLHIGCVCYPSLLSSPPNTHIHA